MCQSISLVNAALPMQWGFPAFSLLLQVPHPHPTVVSEERGTSRTVRRLQPWGGGGLQCVGGGQGVKIIPLVKCK